jgi:hypothetical protein
LLAPPLTKKFQFTAHPTFNIGFPEPEITGCRDAVTFLTATVNEVEQIVEATEIVDWALPRRAAGI